MLCFRTYGEVAKPALIFLHGFLGCKEDFHEIASALKNQYFCVCIDLPGHGQSPWQDDPIGAIHTTIMSLSLINPAAIGYSLGGRLLLELQALRKEKFSSCFFLAAHPGLDSFEEREERRKKEEGLIHILKTSDIDEFLEKWYDQPLFSSLKNNASLFSKILTKRKEQNMSHLLKMYEMFRLSYQKQFTSFCEPTFFFYGEHDNAFRNLYLNKNWNVVVEKISQSGHAMHIENPKECTHRIRTCLQQTAPH